MTHNTSIISIALLFVTDCKASPSGPNPLTVSWAIVRKLLEGLCVLEVKREAFNYPRIAVYLAKIVFRDEMLRKFRVSTLQLFSGLCSAIDFDEWREWSMSTFAKHIQEAIYNMFAFADSWIHSGRDLYGLTSRLPQLVHYDMLVSTENSSPILVQEDFSNFASLLNELLIEEANSAVWHPDCILWVLSKVSSANPRGVTLRHKAVLHLLRRCLTEETGKPNSSSLTASNFHLAIQAISLFLLKPGPLESCTAIRLAARLHQLAGVILAHPVEEVKSALTTSYLSVTAQFLLSSVAADGMRAVHILRSSTSLHMILRRTMQNLHDDNDCPGCDAALGLSVVGLLLVHSSEDRNDLPAEFRLVILDPFGQEMTSQRKRKLQLDSYVFLLNHRSEPIRAAASLIICAIFCFQLDVYSDQDVILLTRACINAVLNASEDTTADAAILSLCAIFTCGSIPLLLRSCLLNTAFSLVPLCNKCIRLSSDRLEVASDLGRDSRAFFTLILFEVNPLWFNRESLYDLKVLKALAKASQSKATKGATASAAGRLLFRLHDLQPNSEKLKEGATTTDTLFIEDNFLDQSDKHTNTSCPPEPHHSVWSIGSSVSAHANAQTVIGRNMERLLGVLLANSDSTRTHKPDIFACASEGSC